MSDERDPETDQALPVKNEQPYIQDLVLADIEERKALGLKKYGTLLQPFNGRSFLQDAYEEALDLVIYLRGKLEEERQQDTELVERIKEELKHPARVFVLPEGETDFEVIMADAEQLQLWEDEPCD